MIILCSRASWKPASVTWDPSSKTSKWKKCTMIYMQWRQWYLLFYNCIFHIFNYFWSSVLTTMENNKINCGWLSWYHSAWIQIILQALNSMKCNANNLGNSKKNYIFLWAKWWNFLSCLFLCIHMVLSMHMYATYVKVPVEARRRYLIPCGCERLGTKIDCTTRA